MENDEIDSEIPIYIQEYKQLEDVERFLDIIKNNRIYYPTYNRLTIR